MDAAETRNPREEESNRIVQSYMGWSTGAGLIPLPLVDLAAITAVQLRMLYSLSHHYKVPFSRDAAKSIVGALVGGGGAYLLAAPTGSLLKLIPVVGQLAGMLAEPAVAAAATYALGKVFIQHFESGGTFLDFNPDEVRRFYEEHHEAHRAAQSGKTPKTA